MKKLIYLLVACLMAMPIEAQKKKKKKKKKSKTEKQAVGNPNATFLNKNGKFRAALVGDAATSIMLGWDNGQYNPITGKYEATDLNQVFYYDTVDHGTEVEKYANKVSVKPDNKVVFQNDLLNMRNTFVYLKGLKPNTAYYYVIKDNRETTKRLWFKTAPNQNVPMTFISGGDSRGGKGTKLNAAKMVAKLKPTAIFFGGDYTAQGGSSKQWLEWFEIWQNSIASDGRIFPIVNTEGNHDKTKYLAGAFNIIHSGIYYKVTFGKNLLSLYTLNTETGYKDAQDNWFKETVAKDNSIWKSAQYHKPIRPHASHKPEGVQQYARWAPVFEKYHFQLVYESDTHTTKMTYPVVPCKGGEGCDEGFKRDDKKGTVFVGEGCWGAPLRDNNDAKSWTIDTGKFSQFKYLQISPEKTLMKTIKINAKSAGATGENTNNGEYSVPEGMELWESKIGTELTIYP